MNIQKFIKYAQLTTVVAVITATIASIIYYSNYGDVPLGEVVNVTVCTLITLLICIGLREVKFLKPKGNNNEEVIFLYILAVVFAALFAWAYTGSARPMSSSTATICLLGTSAVFAVFHPRYSLAVNLTAVTILLWVGMLGFDYFFKSLGILTLATVTGTIVKFIFFTRWTKFFVERPKRTGNLHSVA